MNKKLSLVVCTLALVVGCQPTEEPKAAPSEPKPTPVATEPKESKPSNSDRESAQRLYDLDSLDTTTVTIGDRPLKVWIMDDMLKRQEGMMYLATDEIPADIGMLFVFPTPQEKGRGFWMKNTLVPLDITYISPKGKVVATVHGKPHDETDLKSPGEFQYVIELPAGQAPKVGLTDGATVDIPERLKANAS